MFEFNIVSFPTKVMRPENGNAELVCDPIRSFNAGFVVAGHIVQRIRIPLPVGGDGNFVEENQFYTRANPVNKVIVVCGSNVSVNVNPAKPKPKGFIALRKGRPVSKFRYGVNCAPTL